PGTFRRYRAATDRQPCIGSAGYAASRSAATALPCFLRTSPRAAARRRRAGCRYRLAPSGRGCPLGPPRPPGPRLAVCLLLPLAAHAQSLNIDLGSAGEAGATGRLVQLTALVTVLSLAPSLLVMVTAFTRIVIVLSLLRSALSTQGTPPNMVLI